MNNVVIVIILVVAGIAATLGTYELIAPDFESLPAVGIFSIPYMIGIFVMGLVCAMDSGDE